MSTTRSIEVIVPVYISKPSLYPIIERCISSLNEFYPDFALHVVDDGSPFPFPDHLTEECDRYTRLHKNQGYTRAVNEGLENSEADIMIIANDDLVFKAGDLDRFRLLKDWVIASPSDSAASPDDRFGSIWGMTRATYDVLGPLEPTLHHFFSDREYYDRALNHGIKIVKWYDIIIEHMESATYKTVDKEALLKADKENYERLYTSGLERTEQ